MKGTTLALAMLAAAPAFAVQINLDTPRSELALKPGQSKRVRIKITNHEEMPVRVKAYLQDVRILPDGSPEFVEPGSTPWSLKDWVSGMPPYFALGGRSNRGVGFTVTVPENARGGQYGAVLFETEPVRARMRGGNAKINVRLASLVLIRVKGTETLEAEIKDFKAWRAKDRAHLKVVVANRGNVLIRPHGTLRLGGGLREEINRAKFALMPGETAEYSADWPVAGLERGILEAVAEVDFGARNILGAKTQLPLR